MGGTNDSLLATKIWQRYWDVTGNFVRLHTTLLASRLALESLLLALKKDAAMTPQLWEGERYRQPREQGSVLSRAEPPDENPALAESFTAILGDSEAENPASEAQVPQSKK